MRYNKLLRLQQTHAYLCIYRHNVLYRNIARYTNCSTCNTLQCFYILALLHDWRCSAKSVASWLEAYIWHVMENNICLHMCRGSFSRLNKLMCGMPPQLTCATGISRTHIQSYFCSRKLAKPQVQQIITAVASSQKLLVQF